MNLQAEIEALKKQSLAEIGEAVSVGNTQAILSGTRRLEKTEALARRYAELEADVALLKNDEAGSEAAAEPSLEPLRNGRSLREQGQAAREAFAQWLESRAIRLHQERGSRWEAPSGAIVGVACATERRPNKWFLGLKDEDYEGIALLCESNAGRPLRFIFPKEFYARYRHSFSISNGQRKFNIFRSGGSFHMPIPGAGKIRINEYLDNVSGLTAI